MKPTFLSAEDTARFSTYIADIDETFDLSDDDTARLVFRGLGWTNAD